MTSAVFDTLQERGAQYGPFEEVARITLALEDILKSGATYDTLNQPSKVALWLVCNKLARLVNGSLKEDTLLDIQGYAQLIIDSYRENGAEK